MIKYLLKRKLEKMFTIKVISIDKHTITVKPVGKTLHLNLEAMNRAISSESNKDVIIDV